MAVAGCAAPTPIRSPLPVIESGKAVARKPGWTPPVTEAARPGASAPTKSPAPDIHLPTTTAPARQALFIGELTLERGCLRLGRGGDSNLLLWPTGSRVFRDAGGVGVTLPNGTEVRVGQTLRMSGAALSRAQLGPDIPQGLPSSRQCPDPLVIAGAITQDAQ